MSQSFAYALTQSTVSKISKYLGFVSTSDLKDDDDMNRQLRSIYGSATKLRRKFFCCSKAIKNCLFRTSVSCLYGSRPTVWCMYRKSTFNRLRVGYNNACRILFNLPRRTSMSTTLVRNNVPTFHQARRQESVTGGGAEINLGGAQEVDLCEFERGTGAREIYSSVDQTN